MLNERNIPLEEDGIEEEILVDDELAITKAMWGDIGGNIENQTDLQNALDAKQDSLTEAQLNAVNSGITTEKVTTYDGYADQIASKADQSALNAEASTREQADTALGRRIDNEALARQQADNGLQTQIDAITSKSDVVDVVANYAALQAYDTSTLGNNDVIKVLDDETHEDALTYYRWSTATQAWSYIGQEAPYYSKGQMDVMLQGKQDKLTAGANIQIQNGTISATDTTYTAGNGLNLNDTEFSADTDVLATKEDLEGYYTKPETDNLLAPKLEAEVVAELPTAGEEGKLYLTPKAHTTQTATGNPITATVAEDAGAIESFQLDGDTYQQTYTGKNLLPPNRNQIVAGISIVWNSDGTVDITGTATGEWPALTELPYALGATIPSGTQLTLSMTAPLPTGTRLWLREYNVGETAYKNHSIPNNDTSVTFSISADMDRVGLILETTPGTTLDVRGLGIMLEVGSTATPYEPYVGGVPAPNPDYPQPIQTVTGEQTVTVVGKNVYNDTLEAGSISSTDGTNAYATERVRNKGYVAVLPDTEYTIENTGNASIAMRYYSADGSFISGTSATANPKTFTTPANATQVRFVLVSSDTTLNVQIELGSTATAYTPYSKQTLPISLGSIELCKLGDYQDYIWKDGDDWKVHKATASITLDGTEAWIYAGNYNYARCPSYTFVDKPLGGTGLGLQLSNYFGVITDWGTFRDSTSRNAFFPLLDEDYKISIRNTGCTSVEDYILWLSTNKPSFYYPVATPTDTVITDQTLIAQLEAIRTALLENGANTITNTATGSNLAGDMEIGYYGFNPRNRYDKWLWLDISNEYEQIGS